MEKMEVKEKRNSFSSSLGFVLAAAGSAVGLGNIWRFPYLAAKNGGGLFLVVYLVLAVTFGFTLLVTEVAIGRKTKQGCLTAYGVLHSKSKWIGVFAEIVPFMILPYYCIIGGWVLKYFTVFITGSGASAAEDGFFNMFITGGVSDPEAMGTGELISSIAPPVVFDVIFLAATALVIYMGVNKGIEAISKILMPLLLLAIIGIAIFSLTLKGDDGRTGFEGFKIFVVPNLDGIGPKEFFNVVLDAMGQLFYSISVAMGIMVTYGSYFRDDDNLMKSVNRIEIFDTLVAFLAGVMIIPAVFAFLGKDGMSAGPGLMFVALPKVFKAMGPAGTWIGAAFFLMVLFAALTSSISIMEAVVSGFMDKFGWSRKRSVFIETAAALVLGIFICLGYNLFMFEIKLPNGSGAQILDIFDYISNNILMPVVAISTCILIGWVIKPKTVID
ncbi:sodium-dependent transporter [Ruminococcus sp.]|uniref:sodium-dependent transporter n=1 Tax=Ruminococcus sp. TaxID=41978 RepID=UPI0034465FD2